MTVEHSGEIPPQPAVEHELRGVALARSVCPPGADWIRWHHLFVRRRRWSDELDAIIERLYGESDSMGEAA